ncbi:cytochrome P450 2J4-like isoform X2 [Microtus oregoni]|uniref:cytochrome P450 2J4-like isoform X2 n=1 Tax=Microtus oregoni TaxID=111838 RepID=UPI001BB1663E|nr:cytochrome P450 2J4-like isoform X2 [Microtus oregoni]
MLAAAGSLVAAVWAALHLRTLLLAAVTFLFLADYLKNRRPKNYPPGPRGLPFVGSIFQLDLEKPHLSIQPFVKKYGNIFSLNFVGVNSIMVTGLPLIKEVFTHMEENILKRPISRLRERITNNNGQPFNPHFSINNAVSNIICSVTFGERFEYHDSQFQEMLRLLDEATCLEASMMCQLYNVFPWIMKYLPGSHQTVIRNWEKLKSFVSSIIDNHRRDWNPDEPRDFIDAFLTEMTKYPEKTTSFNEENLITSTLDLFFAGTETTSTTLRWALLYMAVYPDVQEKVQAEIDRVIGQNRQASLADRESMPYTNAVVHEVQRMGNIIPLNVPREVSKDTSLNGFHFPKGTMLLTNLTALHSDPKEWATPETFNPEHFLENGQFKKRESFLPFSMGKRACLGEQLARSELFIFFTALLQNFTFKPPVNEKLSLKCRMGLTHSPVTHCLCAVPRL